jgi:hypothetical protein
MLRLFLDKSTKTVYRLAHFAYVDYSKSTRQLEIKMKKLLITIWLTFLCFMLMGNVHAWEIPPYLRINSGARMWFSNLQGDLIQPNRSKIDFSDALGLSTERLAWEIFGSLRIDNIHVFRFRAEPFTKYESSNGSYQVIRDFRFGYDLDFFMSPQILFGGNIELSALSLETKVNNVIAGDIAYNYHENRTRAVPLLGLHGTFFPVMDSIALRPHFSSRFGWWNYESLEAWDWEIAAAVDIPINRLWTWGLSGGFRFWHTKMKREFDTVDLNRNGFFLETNLLF